MEVVETDISYKRSDAVKNLYFLGDIHCGTIAHCEDNLDDAIETIHDDKNALWIGPGDNGEFIVPDDPRWQQEMLAPWLRDVEDDIAYWQAKYIVRKFKSIKDKCLGLSWGNHEEQYRRHKSGNVHTHICEELGVKNLGFSSFLDLIFKRESSKEHHLIRICGTHGSSNAITSSGKQNILTRWMNQNNAHIYWYGHMHDILHKSKEFLDVSQTHKIISRESLGVVTGSFYKAYLQGVTATYAEKRNYPPNKIGYPMVKINIEEMSLTFSEKVYLKG